MTGTDKTRQLTPIAALNIVLRHRRMLLRFAGAAGAIAMLAALLTTDYTASVSFVPNSGASLSGLASVAAQFGVDISALGSAAGQGQSPDFYAKLLSSRAVLEDVALTTYVFPKDEEDPGSDTLRGTIIDLLKVHGDDPDEKLRHAVKKLNDDMIDVTTDVRSGVVTISVTADWQALAEQMAKKLLDRVNQFNVEVGQVQARLERHFDEQRRAEAEKDLEQAEDAMQAFLDQNRSIENSARLKFEMGRLQRRIDLRQSVYLALSQAYEQARIQEVRNTPVITVIDQPTSGSAKRNRGLVVAFAIGAVLGTLIGIGLLAIDEVVRRLRSSQPENFDELETHGRAIAAVLRWPFRRKRAGQPAG